MGLVLLLMQLPAPDVNINNGTTDLTTVLIVCAWKLFCSWKQMKYQWDFPALK